MVVPGRLLRYFQAKRSILALIVASFLMLVTFSLSIVTGYCIGRESERKGTLPRSLEDSSLIVSSPTPERCQDTEMINNKHPMVKINGNLGLLEAHCEGLVFKKSKPGGFEESKYVYTSPSECQIVSSLMSFDNKVLAFYMGESPHYYIYEENECKNKGLYFFNVESQELIQGPPHSSLGTILIPTFWSSDNKKVYCEVDRPWGEGCQPLEVIEIGAIETQRTPICGYFFQNEGNPDDFIHLTSSENAPAPCYGVKIQDQISRFNAKTGVNDVLFESKDEKHLIILEAFDNNRYVLVEKTEDWPCDTAGTSSYFIFDTTTKNVTNI